MGYTGGGCAVAFGPLEKSTGVDCTAIEGVSDVGCVAGTCVVKRCSRGWALSEDGTSCVPFGKGYSYIDQTVW